MKKVAVIALIVGVVGADRSKADDKALFQTTDLFTAGEAGYETFRIPGIVVTAKGTLVAYCEARMGSRSDWANIDIHLRRSTNGKTWSPSRKLIDSGTDTVNNPVAIVDRREGVLHFLYCINYARCYYMRSEDDGATFSDAVEITDVFEKFRPDYDWNVIATGPGHGIELTNGRLLVPVWLSTGGKRHRPSCVSVIYSDDHGTSWHRGEIVCGHPEPLVNPSETLAVELSDGRVMLNIRNENKDFRRAISFSADGARRWSKPRFDDQLFDPICMGSLIRLRRQQPGRLLFANPDSASVHRKTKSRYGFRTRENLTVRLSRDDGKSWPVSRVIDSGVSGYSDLAEAADGSVYCLYERGGEEGFAFEHLTLVHFDLDWLTTDP